MTTASSEPSTSRIIMYHREASGRTAIHRSTWSLPCRWVYERFQSLRIEGKRVLDYGCGHGADVKALRTAHVDATGFDPVHNPVQGIAGSFDYVLCTYVLNTLPTKAERMFVVQGVLAALKPGGHAFVTVRRDVKHDGWTSKGTYQTGSVDLSLEMGETMPEIRCTTAHKLSAFEIYLITKPGG